MPVSLSGRRTATCLFTVSVTGQQACKTERHVYLPDHLVIIPITSSSSEHLKHDHRQHERPQHDGHELHEDDGDMTADTMHDKDVNDVSCSIKVLVTTWCLARKVVLKRYADEDPQYRGYDDDLDH
jgi:hypothetical protein